MLFAITVVIVIALALVVYFAATMPKQVVKREGFRIQVKITHMNQVKGRRDYENLVSFVCTEKDCFLAGVVKVDDKVFARYNVGDNTGINVWHYLLRNGKNVYKYDLF